MCTSTYVSGIKVQSFLASKLIEIFQFLKKRGHRPVCPTLATLLRMLSLFLSKNVFKPMSNQNYNEQTLNLKNVKKTKTHGHMTYFVCKLLGNNK